MALATVEAIRDRILTVLESLTPTSLSSDKFRRYRNEGAGDFTDWAEKSLSAAFRRIQIRNLGDDTTPETTSGIEERVRVTFEFRVAYPQNHRYGGANALDRDDVIEQDWRSINYAVCLYGRANFSSTHDCTPLPAEKSIDRASGVDFLVVRATYEYLRLIA